jgi:hypothetical protein
MCLVWLITLVVYGLFIGRDFPVIVWFLLVPFFVQDHYDGHN